MEDDMSGSPGRLAIAALLAVLFAVPAGVLAQAPGGKPVTGLSMTKAYKGEGKVTAIDRGTRTVTLVTADGRTITHKVSEAVRNLDQVKVGDTVVAAYEERTTYVLSGPNARMPGNQEMIVAGRTTKGQKPAGGVMREGVGSFTVVSTDTQANTITLVDAAGGQVYTYSVNDPAARTELGRVKPGDFLTMIDQQILVAGVVSKP
jgi:hypothetical protein